jgi:hypothetical protein
MSVPAILTRSLYAVTILSFVVTVVCLTFIAPASAIDYTGWDFDFNVQPSVIEVGQMVNVSVHVFYYGNDSHGKPFMNDAPETTVTITSYFFNTIEKTNENGWLINADHPDVPGNYTYTAKVIFDAEVKTKELTLVVNPAAVVTAAPVSGSPSPTIAPTAQPSPTIAPANETGTPVPTVSEIPVVSDMPTPSQTATPAPTKSPSGILTILGTVSVLMIVGLLSRKKK